MVTEIIGPRMWQRYEDRRRVAQGENVLGCVPVVHIQNVAQPYSYEGISDVAQLIGLQDELNTRLSDRASRITFQAFKMYLAKGLDGLIDKPVGPGRVWFTDNPEASLQAFGGDAPSPSEDRHIDEVRDAMDKVSGVTPVVAGLLKNKLGNLTSGVALKMTFMGMLARTSRKQFTYGQGLRQIARLVLATLDACGVYRTRPSEREFDVQFANPLPENMMERLEEARIKKELGVAGETVLGELGY
ncbi:MAG: phage portal protein [Phycisphaerae bacterium]|nr:phage portal protein [Phycisphaerae bacterium]